MPPDKLRDYKAKRDFQETPEPSGKRKRASKPKLPRFVIQEHHATRLHWDLRLEHDGALASWAVPNGLPDAPKDNRLAVRTEDHPLEYLTFHGEIPKGSYGAGTMTIWDQGTYELLKWEPRKVEVHFHGERLDARYALFAIDKSDPPKDWMIHRMDPPADPDREPMPEQVLPMLARAGGLPRDDERWGYEIKWDGVRAITFSEPGRMRLQARSGTDITGRYPELARLNRALSSHAAILDGEIVAFGPDGRPSFEALQRRMHVTAESSVRRLAKALPVTYMIFDLLWLDGHSLMPLPYAQRRERLAELALDGDRWHAPEHVVGSGAEVLAVSAGQGLEGVIAKRLDCPYEPGRRSTCWIKIKNVQREELPICGWLPGEGRRRDRIGALIVGKRDEAGKLRYAGRVGTGFTESELDRLRDLLVPLETKASAFEDGPSPPKEAIFVEPRHHASVEFLEWTREGVLRAPSYKGLVDPVVIRDETAKAATVEISDPTHPREVRLANPRKVLYPKTGFAKRDLVEYYAGIARVLLPHLHDRPLTLKRYPNGVEDQFFYEKNAPSHRPDWVQVTPTLHDIQYVLVQDLATLVWLGNLADLELHTSLAHVHDYDCPAMVVFDLDPGPGTSIVECCEVALLLKGMFSGLGLKTLAKTSGSKGMQVYAPLNDPTVTYDQTKPFAKAVAETLEQGRPDLVVSRMTKTLRKERVFVDWSQNDRHKTTVNVYSPRAKDRPTVSTPITWDEVRACNEAGDPSLLVFDTAQVLARVEDQGDLFAEALALTQQLPGPR
ncbi:MAG: DNA ligase D [Actinobacteria bacterium]|nr:MAG: DNA ligase D [Actinomycetota bacterium]